MGRPSSFSQQVADEICRRMCEGETLSEICEDEHMPDRVTVWRWSNSHPDFATQCARARVYLGHHFGDQIKRRIDRITQKTAYADSVAINALQWMAMKTAPKDFGDKQEVTHEAGDTLTQFLDKVRKS